LDHFTPSSFDIAGRREFKRELLFTTRLCGYQEFIFKLRKRHYKQRHHEHKPQKDYSSLAATSARFPDHTFHGS